MSLDKCFSYKKANLTFILLEFQ